MQIFRRSPAWHGFLTFLICALAACAAPRGVPAPAVPADQLLIFHNGAIITLDDHQPLAHAIALQGQKILAVGNDDDILALRTPTAQVINLHGLALLPGFIDAHTHVLNDAESQNLSLDQAQMLMLANGITTVGDMYVERRFLSELQAFDQAGQLRLRTSLYLVFNDPCGEGKGNWYKEFPPTRAPGEMLRIGGVKIFTDGGSCGKPALSFELDKGQGLGDLWLTQDQLNTAVAEAQAAGYQVAIHAIGDRAVEQAQNAIAFALSGQPNTYRHRMEHVSVIRPEQLARFGQIGIIPVINGQYNACHPFASDIPEPYHDWEWPWRALREANPGLPIAWHADYPFLNVSPIVHLYGFVTRKDGEPAGYDCLPHAWLRDDLLTVEEALRAMTIDAAYALFRDEEVGSLVPGKFADVIVLSANPLAVEAAEIKRLKVLLTIVGGRTEYCVTATHADLCPTFKNRIPLGIPDSRWPAPIRWGLFIPLGLGLTLFSALTLGGRIPQSKLIQWGAVSAMAGGVLWMGLWSAAENNWEGPGNKYQWAFVYPLLFLIAGLVSLQLAQAQRAGKWGWLAFGVTGLAMVVWLVAWLVALWVLDDLEPRPEWGDYLWPALTLSLLMTFVGLVLLGVVAWRAKTLPTWCAGLMVITGVLVPVALFGQWGGVASLGGMLFGGAWLAVGAVVWRTSRRQ